MITVQLQKEYESKPEIVFDLLADHTKHPLWDPNMIEASLYDEGPIVKGSKGITVGIFQGRKIESEVYYDAYDRPRYVSGGTTSGSVKGKNTCEFIPTESGTKINWRLEAEFKGFMRLLEPFMRSSLIKQREETLDALGDYLAKNPSQSSH
ncbi:MAG: SRPBCC family protein [Anaerolineales bacterium]